MILPHRRLLYVLAACICAPLTSAYFQVPFYTTGYYGPDGPWQAVIVDVGGTDPDLTLASQQTRMHLIPGGGYVSYMPTNENCMHLGGNTCGAGNRWEPVGHGTGWGIKDAFQPLTFDAATAMNISNATQYAQGMAIHGQVFFNVSLAAVFGGVINDRDGTRYGPECGTLALGPNIGEEDEVQKLSTNTNDTETAPIEVWIFPGALYNQSKTKSYSYGLHIGSAPLNYPGSLIFGGYDKGRAIGPYTTFGDTWPTLNDISIGVEIGGSPFEFDDTKSKLLIDNTSTPNSMVVKIDPTVPYLHLPNDTCAAIVKNLPVYWDNDLKFFLWNTSDPQYTNITTSPAYLGFSFPPAPGDTDDVIIKVPFALLNLTLDTPLVAEPTTYFPCRDFIPPKDDYYRLGRAFLQAAFIGRNWKSHTSWLAQAPGPGDAGTGLGEQLTDIEDGDTTIPLFNDSSLFSSSWANFWNPLPGKSVSNNANATTNDTLPADTQSSTSSATASAQTSSSSSSLSTGAKAGIAVGVATLGLGIVVGAFLLRRRHKQRQATELEKKQMTNHNQGHPNGYDSQVQSWITVESPSNKPPQEIMTNDTVHEMPSTPYGKGSREMAHRVEM